jgi:hypothetical protein
MSYIFDVSSEFNDLLEVNDFVLYRGHGDYNRCNRDDGKGHTIFNVIFRDKRYALQFKLKFNVTVVKWDESDNEEITTIDDLLARGYMKMELTIDFSRSQEFHQWCKERDIVVIEEFKFISMGREPMTLYVPDRGRQMLAKLIWG